MAILQSDFTGLNEHLLISIFKSNRKGEMEGDIEVRAPVQEPSLEFTHNWQSPFEDASPDSKIPALAAMVQSGAIKSTMIALQDTGLFGNVGNDVIESLKNSASEFEGSTGMTKLNSTQIYTGMQPIKFSGTLIFRAFADAINEVSAPYQQLLEWSLPNELAPEPVSANVIQTFSAGGNPGDYLKALFPSKAPTIIGITYKKTTIAPMVIESITENMDAPITRDGDYVYLEVPVSISSLHAIDKMDMAKMKNNQGTIDNWSSWWDDFYYF